MGIFYVMDIVKGQGCPFFVHSGHLLQLRIFLPDFLYVLARFFEIIHFKGFFVRLIVCQGGFCRESQLLLNFP